MERLHGLQVLRGLAAILVVWSHVQYNLGVEPSYLADKPWLANKIGAIGVDIFFVISGFVIAMTASRMGRDWRAFLIGRISRVVPLYFAVSGFLLVIFVIGFTEFGIRLDNSRQILNSFMFLPLFDSSGFTDPVCGNGWTLSFEAWFYILFAVLMCRLGPRVATILPMVMVAGVCATAAFYQNTYWYLPKFLFHPLTLEFSGGCLLYHFRNRMGPRVFILMSCLLPIFFCWAYHNQTLALHDRVMDDVRMGFVRAGVWGGFSICLVGIVTQLDLKRRLQWPSLLLLMGNASYSIYLIAPLIMPVFWNVTMHVFHRSCPPIVNGCVYVAGTMGCGLLSWKYFEMPATNWTKKHLRMGSRANVIGGEVANLSTQP